MNKISIAYPDTWLTISISVKNRDTWVLYTSGTMTETNTRSYKFDFTEEVNTDYDYLATVAGYDDLPWTIFRDGGWLTTLENDKLMWIYWGGGITSQVVQSIVEKAKKEIIEKVEEIPQTDLTEVNDKLDILSIAKTDILNTIKSSEKEICNDIKTTNKELKEDNVTTRQLVRQKTKKLDENVSKLSDRQEMTDKTIEDQAEELEEEIERILEEEADFIENQQFNQEAQEIESEISNQETNGNI